MKQPEFYNNGNTSLRLGFHAALKACHPFIIYDQLFDVVFREQGVLFEGFCIQFKSGIFYLFIEVGKVIRKLDIDFQNVDFFVGGAPQYFGVNCLQTLLRIGFIHLIVIRKKAFFAVVADLNPNVSIRQFHTVISTKGTAHDSATLKMITEAYLSKMGYDKNPYLLYISPRPRQQPCPHRDHVNMMPLASSS
jgi:hypothetical protein